MDGLWWYLGAVTKAHGTHGKDGAAYKISVGELERKRTSGT
jgi:hypothetical protein